MAGETPEDLRAENERLRAENDELRLRLDEAQQTIEAIRTGQAESLVVEGPEGPRIFSLEGADHAYRIMVEAMNEGAATLGEDGTILYCNSRFAQMLEAPLEQVMGSAVRRFLPERSLDTFEALQRDANGADSRGELELLTLGGDFVPAYLSVSVVQNGGGRRLCMLATDLRAQKRADEILAAERLARSVLDQAADAIIVCDENGRMIRASRSAVALAGDNPLLTPFERAFPLVLSAAGGDAQGREVLERAMRGEELRAVPASLVRKDGSRAGLLVSANALHAWDRGAVGCVVTAVDITERRQAEEDRARLLAELQATLSAMTDGLVIYRPDASVALVNPAAERIFGWPAEMWKAPLADRVRITQLTNEARVPCAPEETPLACALRGETVPTRLLLVQRPDRSDVWVATGAAPIVTQQGERLGAVVVYSDMTSRVLLEEQQKDLLRVVSHDLRTPLGSVMMQAQILQRTAPPGDPSLRRAEMILRNGLQMQAMINDLVEMARLESGQLELKLQPVDLPAFVGDLKERLAGTLEVGRLRIVCGPELPLVSADPERLERVLVNLLTNAMKYSTPPSDVVLEMISAGHAVTITVADHGQGIAKDELPRLFDRFYRARAGRGTPGLGLGLYIAGVLVRAHGGTIQVESELGKGSTFRVMLPLETPPQTF